MYCRGFIEDDPKLLFTVLRSAPAHTAVSLKNRLHREMRIFRGNFDGGYLFKIKPPVIQVHGFAQDYFRAHYPLTHKLILPVTESSAWPGEVLLQQPKLYSRAAVFCWAFSQEDSREVNGCIRTIFHPLATLLRSCQTPTDQRQ